MLLHRYDFNKRRRVGSRFSSLARSCPCLASVSVDDTSGVENLKRAIALEEHRASVRKC